MAGAWECLSVWAWGFLGGGYPGQDSFGGVLERDGSGTNLDMSFNGSWTRVDVKLGKRMDLLVQGSGWLPVSSAAARSPPAWRIIPLTALLG